VKIFRNNPLKLNSDARKKMQPIRKATMEIVPGLAPMAIAIAEVAFNGWTGIGNLKYSPAAIYIAPAERKMAVGFIPLTVMSPTAKGRNVAKSPKDPATSLRSTFIRRVR
jgi:hypothetical protein